MNDPFSLSVSAAAALLGLMIACATLLRAWNGWLELKRLELSGGRAVRSTGPTAARIEIAALRERVRKLEAIAEGIDL